MLFCHDEKKKNIQWKVLFFVRYENRKKNKINILGMKITYNERRIIDLKNGDVYEKNMDDYDNALSVKRLYGCF